MMIKVAILTASDKGSVGERIDVSGETIINIVKQQLDAEVVDYKIIPDERALIASELIRISDQSEADLILTTGGTGFSPRDVTPEATLDVVQRLVPGLPEAMRAKSLEVTPRAMLSRAVAGIRNKTLIINLPGSPKGVSECLSIIMPVIPHAIEILKGNSGDCAR
jgi:molybdopterin adenylyltransferase